MDLDIEEPELNENWTSKEKLPEAFVCRFCGFGIQQDSLLIDESSFYSLFEKYDVQSLSSPKHPSSSTVQGRTETVTDTLESIINKYLPIKVSELDQFYPRVICSSCFYSLELTVAFFNKIAEGQKILSKVVNRSVTKESETKKTIMRWEYCEQNPIMLAPKKRGRPRKDPNQMKEAKKEPQSNIYSDKPKRQSKAPVRFRSDDYLSLVSESIFQIKKEEEEVNNDLNKEGFDTFIHDDGGENDLDETALLTFTSLATRDDNLMDLEKFVIMDGDEETENNEIINTDPDINNKLSETRTTSDLIPSTSTNANTKDEQQALKENLIEEIQEIFAPLNDDENEKDNDSDTSVKTIDFVNRKKPTKKKRKKNKKLKGKEKHCSDCGKIFNNSSSLIYHKTAVHELVKKFICTTCNKAFSHKQLLTNHLYTHRSEKCFKCSLCPAKFKSRASLYTHNKSIHVTKKEFTCEHCGVQFNLKSSLKAHLRLHSGEKPFVCDFCRKRFTQRSNMREHRRVHTGEKPYLCQAPDCGKSFTTASQLRSHKISHSQLKPYLCPTCGKSFSHSENFKYHMRRHLGEKPIECNQCQKTFTEPWSLKKHMRFHTGEKPYVCDICKRTFADPSNFAKHKKLHLLQQQELNEINKNNITSVPVSTAAQLQTLTVDLPIHQSQISEIQHIPVQQNDKNDEVHTNQQLAESMVQVLNAENFAELENGEQEVIYVYPEDLPVFTITLSDNQQAIEVRPIGDQIGPLQALTGDIFTLPTENETFQYGQILNNTSSS